MSRPLILPGSVTLKATEDAMDNVLANMEQLPGNSVLPFILSEMLSGVYRPHPPTTTPAPHHAP